MNQASQADNGPELTDQQMTQIEIDMRVAFDSGYGLNNLNVPIQLQRLFNDLNSEYLEKRTAEEDLLRLANLAEEKNGKNKETDMAEAMYDAVSQQWLKSRHEFAGMNLTGAEWRHVADYARQNRERIFQQWMEDGLTKEEAETGLQALDIMGRGGPKTEAEKEIWQEAQGNKKIHTKLEETAKEAGVDPAKPESKASISSPATSAPAAVPEMSV